MIIAAAVVLLMGIAIAGVWGGIGDSEISAAGVGLMALVFISSRRGYDEGQPKDC